MQTNEFGATEPRGRERRATASRRRVWRVALAAAVSAAALATAGAGLVKPDPAAAAPHDGVPCDQQCQDQWQRQRADALPRSAFYDAPTPLPWAAAGSVIRTQRTDEYVVNGVRVTGTRVLYHSRTSAGRDVAASGVIISPAGTPPPGGWPVVADAHGTSGVARDCAPSLMRDLYHGDQLLRFVAKGWAVVAPDYAGLGTNGRDEYLNVSAESADVINAVRAARTALPDLSRRWVVWGHSQGGGAALAVAHAQAVHRMPGYLGTVATAPVADLTATITRGARIPGLGGFIPLIVDGARNTDPATPAARILTEQALDRLPVTRTGCAGVVIATYQDLYGSDLVRADFQSEPHLANFLTANSTGRQATAGPVLLLQGDADAVVPRSITDNVAASLCRLGADLNYRTYPGVGHETTPGQQLGIDDAGMTDILTWIGDRFAGTRTANTC